MRSERTDWRGDEERIKRQLSILAAAIKVESQAKDYYSSLSKSIMDKEGKRILNRLAEDEKEHRIWLEELIDRISPGRIPESIEPDSEYISIFHVNSLVMPANGKYLGPKEEIKAVELAIQIEKDTSKMFTEASDLSGDLETKMALKRIARWEVGHQKILEDNLHYLQKGGSWYENNPVY